MGYRTICVAPHLFSIFNDLSGLNNGDEVVVTGTRSEVGKKDEPVKTQIVIDDCSLVAVVGTNKQYSTKSFTEIAFKDLMDTDFTIADTAKIYKTSAADSKCGEYKCLGL